MPTDHGFQGIPRFLGSRTIIWPLWMITWHILDNSEFFCYNKYKPWRFIDASFGVMHPNKIKFRCHKLCVFIYTKMNICNEGPDFREVFYAGE